MLTTQTVLVRVSRWLVVKVGCVGRGVPVEDDEFPAWRPITPTLAAGIATVPVGEEMLPAVKIVRVQFSISVMTIELAHTDLVLVLVTVTVVGPRGEDVTVTVAVIVTVGLVVVLGGSTWRRR